MFQSWTVSAYWHILKAVNTLISKNGFVHDNETVPCVSKLLFWNVLFIKCIFIPDFSGCFFFISWWFFSGLIHFQVRQTDSLEPAKSCPEHITFPFYICRAAQYQLGRPMHCLLYLHLLQSLQVLMTAKLLKIFSPHHVKASISFSTYRTDPAVSSMFLDHVQFFLYNSIEKMYRQILTTLRTA